MIRVAPVKEPETFDRSARKPGAKWLRENPGAARPKDLWSPHLAALASGFDNLCAYAAMLDPTGGSVDHYLSFRNYPKLAYEWSNYRFASQTLNASKRTADDAVLDPFQVGDGWFEIILPSLQMRVTRKVPPKLRRKAEFTLERLKLRDGEKIIRWRQRWYELYTSGALNLAGLERVAPLLAAAVRAGLPAKRKVRKRPKR